jgi:redox-sensitive bicupin YhaK (pirin superfamily)
MIIKTFPLEFQWPTQGPFLFCAHHHDLYPEGGAHFGPDPYLFKGRNMGSDFEPRGGWRMYHGDTVPGFPVHPHRGFETITVVRKGYIDHADSMGAAGRYGGGDVQWMTAGRGMQHSEMFPLLKPDADNTVELFQIWLNLPSARKMTDPDFKMFWNEAIPVVELEDQGARITVIAGRLGDTQPLAPPQASWAHNPDTETAIWLIQLSPGGELEIPASQQHVSRSLYFFDGSTISIADQTIQAKTGLFVGSHEPLKIKAGQKPAELLLLQSKPIEETVAQYGPFVMNTQDEIKQTIEEYRKTQFGGWPWERKDMVHGPGLERFAKYPDGRVDLPHRLRVEQSRTQES